MDTNCALCIVQQVLIFYSCKIFDLLSTTFRIEPRIINTLVSGKNIIFMGIANTFLFATSRADIIDHISCIVSRGLP